jgi:hypothetical protein
MKRGSPALGFLRVLASALALVQAAPLALFASPPQQVTQAVTATATFGPRIALQVSSQVLHFHVTDPSAPALMSVDFAVGGRTGKDGELVLAVEVVEPPRSSPYSLTIAGGSDGVAAGPLAADVPKVVARWPGGGFQSGRVTFRLDAAPGRYEIPLRFLVKLSGAS